MTAVIREWVPMYTYTTLRVGGKARYFITVESEEDIEKAGQFAKQTDLPFLVLGGGSNMLIDDEGYSGIVIFNKMKGREYIKNKDGSTTLICQAGEVLDEVIDDTVTKGYWGLENLSAIPGTVGAVPVQNVGAYGVEVSELIEYVETYHVPTNTKSLLKNIDCGFGYRDSFFKSNKGKEYIITSVHFRLNNISNPKIGYSDLKKYFTDNNPEQLDIRKAIIDIRSKKFPDWHEVGTAGSFFKNPIITKEEAVKLLDIYPDLPTYNTDNGRVKISLGYVLDKICNLKGYRKGDVALFSNQALVLVNYGNRNADEIKNFSDQIIKKVFDETKIIIIPEVNFF
jgi:UDP-N-acetylmuramate dehydrogenase